MEASFQSHNDRRRCPRRVHPLYDDSAPIFSGSQPERCSDQTEASQFGVWRCPSTFDDPGSSGPTLPALRSASMVHLQLVLTYSATILRHNENMSRLRK